MQIYGKNRNHFFQWDLNQKITDAGFKVGDSVHFANDEQETALVVQAYELDGKVVADVPNILLQSNSIIAVYHYVCGEHDCTSTMRQRTFKVIERAKPDDYIYTEEERKTWEHLDQKIDDVDQKLSEQILNVEIDLLDRKLDKTEAKTLYSNILKGSKTETASRVVINDILEDSLIDVEVTALNQTTYPYDGKKSPDGAIVFTPSTINPKRINIGMGRNDSGDELFYHFMVWQRSNFKLKPNTTYVVRSNIPNEDYTPDDPIFPYMKFQLRRSTTQAGKYDKDCDFSTNRYMNYGGKRGECVFTTPNEELFIHRLSIVVPKNGSVTTNTEYCMPEIFEVPTYIEVSDGYADGNKCDWTEKNHYRQVYTYRNIKGYCPTTCISVYGTDTEYNIKCTYNRDINSAFEELKQAIISLGGNV